MGGPFAQHLLLGLHVEGTAVASPSERFLRWFMQNHALCSLLLAAGLAALVCAWCGPRLDKERYGEVLFRIPSVEGADKPYPLPELESGPDQKPTAPQPSAE